MFTPTFKFAGMIKRFAPGLLTTDEGLVPQKSEVAEPR
jgi:hypothetical protein